jgi:hypothetical protein
MESKPKRARGSSRSLGRYSTQIHRSGRVTGNSEAIAAVEPTTTGFVVLQVLFRRARVL